MVRFVELEDGTYRLTVVRETDHVKYKEVSRFVKVKNDPKIPEKEKGYKLTADK